MRVPGIAYVQGRNYSRTSGGKPVVTAKYGIAIHCTANTASAEAEAGYAARRTDDVSSHFYVDGDSVVQSLDTGWRAWHAASSIGNANSISVEITGKTSWSRSQWLSRVAWDRLGQVLAAVIKHHWSDGSFQVRRASVAQMRGNPRVKAFYGHHDMTRAWGGDHTDPGPHFPWDRLFDAVSTALEDDMTPDEVTAAVLKALNTSQPYASAGFGRAQAERGWGPTSARGLAEYAWSDLFSVRAEQDAARQRQEAILSAVSGSSADAILAEIRAQGEQTRAALGGAQAAIVAALPDGDGPVAREDLIAALTTVLGSLDNTPAQVLS